MSHRALSPTSPPPLSLLPLKTKTVDGDFFSPYGCPLFQAELPAKECSQRKIAGFGHLELFRFYTLKTWSSAYSYNPNVATFVFNINEWPII